MKISKIETIKNFIANLRDETGITANFEVNMWARDDKTDISTDYKIWIKDVFYQTTSDIDMLITLIPYMKKICVKNKVVENNATLKELAA